MSMTPPMSVSLIRRSRGVSHVKLGLWFTSISFGVKSSKIRMSKPKISKQLDPKYGS